MDDHGKRIRRSLPELTERERRALTQLAVEELAGRAAAPQTLAALLGVAPGEATALTTQLIAVGCLTPALVLTADGWAALRLRGAV